MQGPEGTAALVSRAENHVGGDPCRRTQYENAIFDSVGRSAAASVTTSWGPIDLEWLGQVALQVSRALLGSGSRAANCNRKHRVPV